MNTYCTNRLDLVRNLMYERGYDALVIRNNADLRWLTGVEGTFDDEDAHTAFITQDQLFLHTDSRYYNNFVERLGASSAWQLDQELTSHARWTAQHALKTRSLSLAIEDNVSLAFYDELKAALLACSIDPHVARLHGDLCDLRMVKDESELDCLRTAQRITDEAFDHICSFIKAGLTEKQVRAELESYMLSHGADGLSFASIVAGGANGANPHAQPSDYVLCEGDLVVLDYGALYRDYHADMTRTVCVGSPSKKQQEVFEIVKRAHEECAAMIKPGISGKEVYDHSMKVIGDAGYGQYYGHGLGHGVGIEIHERPNLSRSYDKPLPEGSVVTVEPGIYLPGEFGIRLEDTGLVGASGYESFARSVHELVSVDVR